MQIEKLMLMALLGCAAAFGVDDGVYERGLGGAPDRRVEIEKIRGYVYSETNDNSGWHLNLQFKKLGKPGRRTCRVVLAGKTFDIETLNSSGKNNLLDLWISKAEVEAATKLFDIKSYERKHPGHMLDAEFKQIEDKDAPGGVRVEFRLKNVGAQPFYFQRGGSQLRDDRYAFSCYGPDGRNVPVKELQNYARMVWVAHLAPGETFTEKVGLKDWFDFTKPGTYYLKGSYQLDIHTMVSTKDDGFAVWQDYVMRSFIVKIAAEKKEN